jgi:hypothetical protein
MPYPVNLDDFNFDSKDITLSAYRLLEDVQKESTRPHKRVDKYLLNKKSSKQDHTKMIK